MKIHFVATQRRKAALTHLDQLINQYGQSTIEQANVIVAMGGDGFMLHTLHLAMQFNKPVFGINFGSVGFLMNKNTEHNLIERIRNAHVVSLRPLKLVVLLCNGKQKKFYALNEVSLLRQLHQVAKIIVKIDGVVRIPALVCDGVLVATPAGSTAYNLSASGPILPINSNLFALTPISAFRPRRWSGALLPNDSKITFEIIDPINRPVSVTADYQEARNICKANICCSKRKSVKLLFDIHQTLHDRIISEQFII